MQWYNLSYCPCFRASAVRLLETKLTRFCLVHSNLENSKKEQDGVRRFTYMRGLVVSWSSLTALQSLSVETWDTLAHVLCILIIYRSASMCISHQCLSKGSVDTRPFTKLTVVLIKIDRSGSLRSEPLQLFYSASGMSLHFVV